LEERVENREQWKRGQQESRGGEGDTGGMEGEKEEGKGRGGRSKKGKERLKGVSAWGG